MFTLQIFDLIAFYLLYYSLYICLIIVKYSRREKKLTKYLDKSGIELGLYISIVFLGK